MGKIIVDKIVPKIFNECDLVVGIGVGLAISCLISLTILLLIN